MKKIYFVRHGQTDCNLNDIIQGSSDIELNENGIKQAYQAKEKLKDISFDKVYVSPLKRARKTAEIICEDRNVEIEVDDRIKEISFGVNEGKKYGSYNHDEFWNVINPCLYPEAEDVRDFLKRVFDFLDSLKEKPEDNVLVVAHGGVAKAVVAYFEGIPEDGNLVGIVKMDNCEVLEFTF